MPEPKREIIVTEKSSHHSFNDLTGKIFGELEVQDFAGKTKTAKRSVWHCLCSCGKLTSVRADRLISGKTRSCGCINKIHGHTRNHKASITYTSYRRARERCTNQKHENYKNYGGRGIEFRFQNFEEFLAAVGERPSKAYTIDRIDNNGHYEKGNLKWSTRSEQRANRRISSR